MNDAAVEENTEPTPAEGVAHGDLPPLFRHSARPQWGLAIMAWEHEGRRGYQFEDGELRVFKEGFFHLLEEVTRPLDQAAATTARLSRAAGLTPDGKKVAAKEDQKVAPVETVPFDRQLAYFVRLYPEGFQDSKWKKLVRGEDAKRRAKKHRDSAIAEAAEKLSAERLDSLLDTGDNLAVASLAAEVLGNTNLCTAAQARQVLDMTRGREKLFSPALRDLLWGDDSIAARVERFIGAVGNPSWPLATAFLALVHPDKHICVHGSTFRSQAAWLAPRMRWSKKPGGQAYADILALAEKIRDSLTEAGYPPADMLDVYDFVRLTLKPSAIEKIRDLPAKAAGDA